MANGTCTHTMSPEIARMMLGEDILVGGGKIVYCDHNKNSIFGGISLDKFKSGGNWEMAAGTLIFVPLKKFSWRDKEGCGWDMCDILTQGGLHPQYWKEKTSG